MRGIKGQPDTRGHVTLADLISLLLAQPCSLQRQWHGLFKTQPGDTCGNHHGHRRGPRNRLAGIVGDTACHGHPPDDLRGLGRRGNADRRHTHGRPVGCALQPRHLGRGPLKQRIQRGFRRRAKQITQPARPDIRLPTHQIARPAKVIKPLRVKQQTARQQQALFGVVGHLRGAQPMRNRVIGKWRDKILDPPVMLRNLGARQGLRGHAKSVADGKPVEGALAAVQCLAVNLHPSELHPHAEMPGVKQGLDKLHNTALGIAGQPPQP